MTENKSVLHSFVCVHGQFHTSIKGSLVQFILMLILDDTSNKPVIRSESCRTM